MASRILLTTFVVSSGFVGCAALERGLLGKPAAPAYNACDPSCYPGQPDRAEESAFFRDAPNIPSHRSPAQ